MKMKEKISIKEVLNQSFNAKQGEASEHGKAVFTHYLHNHQNGASKFYKRGVTLKGRAFRNNLFIRTSQKEFPLQSITQKAA